MFTVATLFWQANRQSYKFSSMYDESWVEKLYRGFARNLTVPWEFICYTDKQYKFQHRAIKQKRLKSLTPGYSDCIQPYELGVPMILVGLDTIVCRNIDHMAYYTRCTDQLVLPRDPYNRARACNGVALVPSGHAHIARKHRGENDMVWVRKFPHRFIDDVYPGEVLSWKVDVAGKNVDPHIIYFHGEDKPHQLLDHAIVRDHWK